MTLSVHTPNHPWCRTLPNPMFTASANSLRSPADQNAPILRHLVDNPIALLASQHEQNVKSVEPPSQIVFHRANLPSRPVHVLQDIAANHLKEAYANANEDQIESDMMLSEEGRRSLSPSGSSAAADASGKYCLCQTELHIPRPRNAFILYRQHQHASVVAQNPNLPNPDISKIIGEQWRALPEDMKEEWKTLADEEKARHSQQYPEYRYRPKRTGKGNTLTSTTGPSTNLASEGYCCQKCGGRVVTVPSLSTQVTTSEGFRNPTSIMSSNQTPYFGSQNAPSSPHNTRSFYPPIETNQPRSDRQSPSYLASGHHGHAVHESNETKRRRLDDPSTPNAYQYHPRPGHNTRITKSSASVQSPMRTSPHARITHPMFQHPQYTPLRKDPSLILPPLQTISGRPRAQPQRRSTLNHKQTIEAMIMSIPVLNKIKILSQISPAYIRSENATDDTNTTGAVIAVEGMDADTVFDMTNSLAEQLEKDGNFAVRIFGGPDPFHLLESQQASTSGASSSMDFSECLENIAKWHTISEEIKSYINAPSTTSVTQASVGFTRETIPPDTHTLDQDTRDRLRSLSGQKSGDGASNFNRVVPRSPISAVSPKTMSHNSPKSSFSASRQPKDVDAVRSGRASFSVHASSHKDLSQLHRSPEMPSESQPEKSESNQDVSHPQDPSRHQSRVGPINTAGLRGADTQTSLPPLSLNVLTGNKPQIRAQSKTTIPIAIVPHYQLTTVNASAMNMPINDTYSPHSHWQWLATLWRGCIGPDITIVLKSTPDDGDMSADGTQSAVTALPGFPSTPGSAHPSSIKQSRLSQMHNANSLSSKSTGVEIRLSDFKTIVVKTGHERRSIIPSSATATTGDLKTASSEAWEKAKRRVGFEVDEYLRK